MGWRYCSKCNEWHFFWSEQEEQERIEKGCSFQAEIIHRYKKDHSLEPRFGDEFFPDYDYVINCYEFSPEVLLRYDERRLIVEILKCHFPGHPIHHLEKFADWYINKGRKLRTRVDV